MELRAGYKNTEVGLIPEDWEVKTYDDVFEFLATATYSRAELTEIDNVKYVHYGDIHTKWNFFLDIKQSNLPTVRDGQVKNYHLLKDGDVIMADASEDYSGIGKSVEVKNLGSVKAISGLHTFLFRDKNEVFVNGFRAYIHFNKVVKTQFDRLATGLKVYGVSKGNLKTVKIPIPTKAEQTAIATALSDADALISGLEKLIIKKRNIKQGAMQILLQPKEGWVEQSIFQIADSKKELFDDGDWIESEHITDKGIRLIQTGNIGVGSYIEKENRKYIYKESFERLGCKLLKVGDLLICRLAEPAGRACIFPFIGEEKVITSVDVTIYRPREEAVNRQFLNQIFSTSNWFRSISDLCGGTTHKRISRGALGRIKILLPKIEEQTRISTILSDMDIEITALETKLGKYRKVKLGMMQNLLTGKIRLV